MKLRPAGGDLDCNFSFQENFSSGVMNAEGKIRGILPVKDIISLYLREPSLAAL